VSNASDGTDVVGRAAGGAAARLLAPEQNSSRREA
jgi:hypothetical protein